MLNNVALRKMGNGRYDAPGEVAYKLNAVSQSCGRELTGTDQPASP